MRSTKLPNLQLFSESTSSIWWNVKLKDRDNDGQLRTTLYDKRDDFNFPIANLQFICCNIPTAPGYGVCFSDKTLHRKLKVEQHEHH
jgi:hypothetical protein